MAGDLPADGGWRAMQTLRDMMRGFPVFTTMLRNVEIAMAKADLAMARLYAGLVPDVALRERVFSMLEAEFGRTRKFVLSIKGQTELLEKISDDANHGAVVVHHQNRHR